MLKAQGCSLREISRLLKLSRNTVRRILRAADDRDVPEPAPCDAQTLSAIEDAFKRARGNVVLVQRMLANEGRHVSYSTLTRWVRDAELRSPPRRSGEYRHEPGAEAQHDTSPHRVTIAGKLITAQCAALVLAYSRRLFVQYYPNFTRFEAKHFLLEAARFMDGTCRLCVIDNTSVMVADGTGADAVMAPEMVAFGRTLGFRFEAHAVNHPDRKGRIERPFYYVETNFLPDRSFSSYKDLNSQVLAWCQDVANRKSKRSLGRMSPEEAYVLEKPHLQPLPRVLPPVYEVSDRSVDLYGYIAVDTNRYSVPERFVMRTVTVYKYPDDIRIYRKGTEIAHHPRLIGQRDARHTLPGHHTIPVRRSRGPAVEEQLLADAHPALGSYSAAFKQRGRGRGARAQRRLLEMQRTYPFAPFIAAVEEALHYGMFDLGRLEKLILKRVQGDFFALDAEVDDDA